MILAELDSVSDSLRAVAHMFIEELSQFASEFASQYGESGLSYDVIGIGIGLSRLWVTYDASVARVVSPSCA